MFSFDLAIWGGIIAAIAGAIGWLIAIVRKAERGKQEKERADAYEKHMDDLSRADRAKPPSVSDDPRNRDNRSGKGKPL